MTNSYLDLVKQTFNFPQEGIEVEIRNSSGDIDNIQALKDSNGDVDFAFIQDGVAKSEGAGTLQSLGSLYYEPVWIMCRCNNRVSHLSHLKGKRIAISAQDVFSKEEGAFTGEVSAKMLFDAGATEVHFLVASPPVKYPDFYGIDTPKQSDLMASHTSVPDMQKFLGATWLFVVVAGEKGEKG
mgnify:CR=1 FL=1